MEVTQVSINRQMDKEDVVLDMEWNKILPCTATWIVLEDIILSEVS